MSLEPNNTITVDGAQQLTLQEYDTGTIPSSAFTSGSVISGSGFYTLGSSQVAADLPVPADFAGTAFVVPQIAGSHSYFFLSPAGTATVTFQVGSNTYTTTAQPGVVNEYDAGSDNTVAARITSDVPILVAHRAYLSGAARDAFPVVSALRRISWRIGIVVMRKNDREILRRAFFFDGLDRNVVRGGDWVLRT
jgi:hypothetical protein